MVAGPMRGPSRSRRVPRRPDARRLRALLTYVFFGESHGAGSRKAGTFAGFMVAPRPRLVRGRHAIWPRGSKYSPRRGAAANKKMGARALQVKDGLKAQFTPPPTPSKKILYKIRFGVVAGECHPPQYFGPGLATCSPEKVRAVLYRAPPCGPCVGSVGVRAFSFSRLPQSLGV